MSLRGLRVGENTEELKTGLQSLPPKCLPTALLPGPPGPPWDFSDICTNPATKGLVLATTKGPLGIYSDCLMTSIILVFKYFKSYPWARGWVAWGGGEQVP